MLYPFRASVCQSGARHSDNAFMSDISFTRVFLIVPLFVYSTRAYGLCDLIHSSFVVVETNICTHPNPSSFCGNVSECHVDLLISLFPVVRFFLYQHLLVLAKSMYLTVT